MVKHLIWIVLAVFLLPLVGYLLSSLRSNETVDIIYFYNPRCIVHNQTESIISQAKDKFGDKLNVTRIFASGFAGDPEDPHDIVDLRKRYNAVGVPTIVVGGDEYTKSYNFRNFKSEICKHFKVKPIQCFI